MPELPTSTARPADAIHRETKWLAAFIIPFLVGGFLLLYPAPTLTGTLFAWPIAPRITAMMLGAAYMGGVYFFGGVLLAERWHHVKVGLLPVTAFASILGVSTLLHWERFTHASLSFAAWLGLYTTAPILVSVAWLRNRREDPAAPDPGDVVMPIGVRAAAAMVGATAGVACLLLLLRPEDTLRLWPWTMNLLEARVTSAMFALPAVMGLGIAADARWSSARLVFQTYGFTLLLILVAVARAWDEFRPGYAGSYLFAGGLLVLLAGVVITYRRLDMRRDPSVS